MRESHQDLRITAAEWDAFLDDLQHTLDTFGVPQAEQDELKALWQARERRSSCEGERIADSREPASLPTGV